MIEVFDGLRDFSSLSVFARMALAVLCGGLIGLERESKLRPAGFRTHILICLGAAVTTLTSQYLMLERGYFTDISRLGAQVIAGVGFIGAGTIIVTRRNRVKGLTTAAGLWTTAAIGLALGAGYYEGAIITTLIVLLAELLFVRLERYILRNVRELNIYVEYGGEHALDYIIEYFRLANIRVSDLEMTRAADMSGGAGVIFTLELTKKTQHEQLLSDLAAVAGVEAVEEL